MLALGREPVDDVARALGERGIDRHARGRLPRPAHPEEAILEGTAAGEQPGAKVVESV